MAQFLVRDLDAKAVERLKARAKRHGRSLQGEVKQVLEQATGYSLEEALEAAGRIRRRFRGRRFTDSAKLIREDRQR